MGTEWIEPGRRPDFNPLSHATLARDLRREATMAEEGRVLEDDFGSTHARRLAGDPAYREAYAAALTDVAERADRASAGEGYCCAPTDAPIGAARGARKVVADPLYPDMLAVVTVAAEDSPLDRAWVRNEITSLQRLAGVMYEADASGLTGYVCNTQVIDRNGAYCLTGRAMSQMVNNSEVNVDAQHYDPTEGTEGKAWRLAQIERRWLGVERTAFARGHLVRKRPCTDPDALVELLDRLVMAYACEDRFFAKQVSQLENDANALIVKGNSPARHRKATVAHH